MGKVKSEGLKKRHLRVRRKVAGTAQRPRLSFHKSLKHIYAQVIDDDQGRTLCSVTTNKKSIKTETKTCCNLTWANTLGNELATLAKEKGVNQVVFDRGGYRYHGIVKAFADAARAGGLKF